DVPIPPVIQFSSNFHVGESSATRDLLAGNSKVYAPGPMCCDLKSVHRGVKRLSKQMHDKYRTKKKMAKKLRQDELHMNRQEFNITALDSAVRENISKNSKMMKLITILNNNNGWLEEDPKEEPEDEDEDMMNDEEDGAEVINPYEEADPYNSPPLTSHEETEFTPPVVQIADDDDVPIPPVIQFSSNF
nr:hypothetical protein [Tanacetum cinerariifolium]